MSIYVFIGFDSKTRLSLDESFSASKIYLLSKPGVDIELSDIEKEKVNLITDVNTLDFYKTMNFETLDENIVFVDCREGKTYLDVMYFLNTSRFDKRSYYGTNETKISVQKFPLINHFNPWSGDLLPPSLNIDEKIQIRNIFENMVKIIISFLSAGFHMNQTNSIPFGWMLNLSTPEITHILNYYEIYPESTDNGLKNFNLDFVHNSQYRRVVTQALIQVCGNFLFRNGYLDYSTVVNWYDIDMWKKISFY